MTSLWTIDLSPSISLVLKVIVKLTSTVLCSLCSSTRHLTSEIQMLMGVSSATNAFSSVDVVAPRHASMLLCTSLKIFVASRISSAEKARVANIRAFASLRSVAICIFDWNFAYSSHHAFSRSLQSSIASAFVGIVSYAAAASSQATCNSCSFSSTLCCSIPAAVKRISALSSFEMVAVSFAGFEFACCFTAVACIFILASRIIFAFAGFCEKTCSVAPIAANGELPYSW